MNFSTPYFIINEAAQGGKAADAWPKIANKIKKEFPHAQFLFTKYPSHASKLAKELAFPEKANGIFPELV